MRTDLPEGERILLIKDGERIILKRLTDLTALQDDVLFAEKTEDANKDGKSVMGLDKPILKLKNPASLDPAGFLAAILAALTFPSRTVPKRCSTRSTSARTPASAWPRR